jgi:peptidyl-prolyl cis-trans isomerase SurA
MANTKNIIMVVLVLSFILIAGCNAPEQEEDMQDFNDFVPDNTEEDVPDNTEEDVPENIPTTPITGNTVAIVNGEEITSEEVASTQQLYSQQGQQVSEEDVLEQIINKIVVEQKIQEENIMITDEEAEAIIEQELSMQGATLDDYKQQLESMSMSYEDELENIKEQVKTQKYWEDELKGQTFDVSEEEALEFYEMYKSQSPEEIPSYEELEPQIIASIEQEKQQEAINILIQEIRANADVEYK